MSRCPCSQLSQRGKRRGLVTECCSGRGRAGESSDLTPQRRICASTRLWTSASDSVRSLLRRCEDRGCSLPFTFDFKRDPVQISRITGLGRKLHTLRKSNVCVLYTAISSAFFLRPSQSPCPCVQSLNCCYGVRLVRASVLGHATLKTPSPVLSCRAFLYSEGCVRCVAIAPYSGTISERRLLICFEFTQ
ncbi:hypothetical protein B0H14DRAFT_1324724 [Mycena olivaceomarginata]|nr:hypothetical protein B0H14DRAFT_1324724 [Mycena olivaceomarginata]